MPVAASTIADYLYCPRGVWLRHRENTQPTPTPEHIHRLIAHCIRKEYALRTPKLLHKAATADDLPDIIEQEFDILCEELPIIYRQRLDAAELAQHLTQQKREGQAERRRFADYLTGMVKELGREQAIQTTTPWKTDYGLRSTSLRLAGRIDKVARTDDEVTPILIRTGAAPDDGVWEADRLQTTTYSLLLEDRYDTTIPYARVEYSQAFESRLVAVTEKLRRQVLRIRDDVECILATDEPPDICPHGYGNRCAGCGLKEICYSI